MTRDEAHDALVQLAREGWLIGVLVFGADECCEHGNRDEQPDNAGPCSSMGFGLCDTVHKPHSWGSDCNRAEQWLMRPKDGLMTEVLAELIADC